MQVLVTGANGLLGANLVRELIADGHRVRAMVRKSSNLQGLAGLALDYAYGDVRDAKALRAAADGCEVMFHTAAVFSYWGYSRDEMMETARAGARNAVDAAKDARVRRLVLTSSTAIFGGTDEPVARDESAPVVESGVPDYFVSKVVQERGALERAREVGVELVVANPTVFVGPYDFRPSSSLATITGYLGDPLKLTYPGGVDIVHAADVGRGHILLAEKGTPGERYILSGEQAEWRAIHRTISELCGVRGPGLTVGRTAARVGATFMELAAKLTKKPPLATRELAQQAGRYFWYRHDKAAKLGYAPRPMRTTLAQTIAWLLTSPHLSASQRAALAPAAEVESEAAAFAA